MLSPPFLLPRGSLYSTGTFHVDVSESFGALQTVTPEALQAGENQAVVAREIIAFETADLTAPYEYDLGSLVRRVRESPGDAHAPDELFVLVTEDIARVQVDESMVGQTVLVKAVSKYQAIADVTAKPVVIQPRTPADVFVPDDVFVPVDPFDLVYDTGTLGAGTGGALSGWSAVNFAAQVPIGAAAVIVRWHAEALRTGGQTGDNLFALEYRRDSSWTAQRFAEQQIILDGVGDSSCHFSGQAILNIGSDLAGEVRYMEQGGGTYQYTVEVVGYLKKP